MGDIDQAPARPALGFPGNIPVFVISLLLGGALLLLALLMLAVWAFNLGLLGTS